MDVNENENSVPAGQDVADQATPLTEEDGVIPTPSKEEELPSEAPYTVDVSKIPLKYKGKEVYANDHDHLIGLAQKGWLYDDRKSSLDKIKADLEQRESQIKQIEEVRQLADAFEANPQFKQYIFDLYQKVQSGQQLSEEEEQDVEGRIKQAIQQEVAPVKQELEEYKEKVAQEKVDKDVQGEIAQLRQKYSDHDWESQNDEGKTLMDEIVQFALDNNMYEAPLEYAYRSFMFDAVRENTKADTLKREQEDKVKKARAGVVEQDSGTQSTPQKKVVKTSDVNFNDVARIALESDEASKLYQ